MMMNVVQLIERVTVAVGKIGSLFLPLLILTILLNVFLRYVFDMGLIELEELQWHLNAIAVLCCLAYTYQADEHVRVDLLHNRLSPMGRSVLEICGILFLFLPFTLLVSWHAWNIASYSWSLREGSPMPSGLPARYLIKGIMALGLSLLVLQGLAILMRSVITIVDHLRSGVR
ncbi:MAG: TRAP transporter small permease subunit [Oceanospirillales bacterium]|nr:TRAP transporter small permease subunit [Oceanospirillales bacterium]